MKKIINNRFDPKVKELDVTFFVTNTSATALLVTVFDIWLDTSS
jgi:hypothetical protein